MLYDFTRQVRASGWERVNALFHGLSWALICILRLRLCQKYNQNHNSFLCLYLHIKRSKPAEANVSPSG